MWGYSSRTGSSSCCHYLLCLWHTDFQIRSNQPIHRAYDASFEAKNLLDIFFPIGHNVLNAYEGMYNQQMCIPCFYSLLYIPWLCKVWFLVLEWTLITLCRLTTRAAPQLPFHRLHGFSGKATIPQNNIVLNQSSQTWLTVAQLWLKGRMMLPYIAAIFRSCISLLC